MAITALTVPSQEVRYNAPRDKALEFVASAETLTSTGYMNSVLGSATQLDLGGGTPVSAVGRCDMIWSTRISAIDMASGDETYRAFLLGSNDTNWANGNVQILDIFDFAAATAGRLIATIVGASPTIPPTGKTALIEQRLVTNLRSGILFRFIRGYLVLGGTTPSITYESWLSRADIDL